MEGKKKSLEQMLFEFAGQPTASNSAKNYKVFMEHWDEIQAEHDKGYRHDLRRFLTFMEEIRNDLITIKKHICRRSMADES